MPHERHRYLNAGVAKALDYSPVVGIVGQRQVGKTTLLEHVCGEYVSFDSMAALSQARADPQLFLSGRKPHFGIDEAQLCAPLFPALKEWVRTRKSKGQFILSGSVRFTSKADIRESLTGRIVALELLPFTMAEAAEQPLPKVCEKLLKARSAADLQFLHTRKSSPQVFARYLEQGGLPGICFFRDAHIREAKFEAHLDTLLNRDIRQIYPTTLLYASLRSLLEYLARHQGRPFEWTEAARASQISTVTLKKVVFALEALFLIRRVAALGDHKPTLFLEDQGMASWLKGSIVDNADDIVRGLYANLRQEYHYRPELGAKILQWRTKNGVEVPLVFASRQGRLGIVPTLSREPAPKTLGSAQSFLKKFPGSKVVVAYGGTEIVCKTPAMFWIPYWLL
jgi:predicted AAA+ superfamily ATPase